jgi:methyl-accepting chemotaxis protein
MKTLNNLKMSAKLLGGFLVVAFFTAIIGGTGYLNMKAINDGMRTMHDDRLVPINQLGQIRAGILTIRGDIYKVLLIPAEKQTSLDRITTTIEQISTDLKAYRETQLLETETAELAVFDPAWKEYQTEIAAVLSLEKAGKSEDALKLLLDDGKAALASRAVSASVDKLLNINVEKASQVKEEGDAVFQLSETMILVTSIFTLLLAIGMGLTLSRSISRPLAEVMETARTVGEVDLKNLTSGLELLSKGDLNVHYSTQSKDLSIHRKDEIGKLAESVNAMISRLHESGVSFRATVASLRKMVGDVTENAENLGTASRQLASAANQASQATSQITITVQQVAVGTGDQANSVNQTASAVEQMTKAIDGVARGAQEQSKAITKASEVTSQISGAIQQVTGNTLAVNRESAAAANAARSGATTVDETLKGMYNIKAKVGDSARKVEEMGRRSEEIGAIVETIEDIASQTNLLALNAAIEAARAGEHGKGFAVVADEVRKLAEKSAAATKEIASLIKAIQMTVAEAVKAMEEGSLEVETGVESANKAGAALSDILKAAEAVKVQALQAGEAAERMNASAGELVSAVDSVSAVVEENTAATEEMAAHSTQVTASIESIASVSQENSASIEEVSASVEQMSAQVEEVTASAHSLDEMAQSLRKLVNQFRLN